MNYLPNEDQNNGIIVIEKNNETPEYIYIPICRQHACRRHRTRVLLTHNQGSILFGNGDLSNAIVTFKFWKEHSLTVVDPNRLRHFRLKTINWEQLLNLCNA